MKKCYLLRNSKGGVNMLRNLAKLITKYAIFVILFWLIITVTLLPFSKKIGENLVGELTPPKMSEALSVHDIIMEEFSEADSQQLIIAIESERSITKSNKDYQSLIEILSTHSDINNVKTYEDEGFDVLKDENNMAIVVTLNSDEIEKSQRITTSLRNELEERDFSFDIYITGLPAVANDLSEVSEKDVARAEQTALPITIVLLIIAFGAIIAAFIPPLVGWSSVVLALGTLLVLTPYYPIHSLAQTVIVMLGLAAGIDYSLLMVTRFREEMLRNHSVEEATERSIVTAGKTILLSGGMIIISLIALLFPQLNLVRSIGIAGMIVILFTMLIAITLVPAILVLLGNRINWPEIIYRYFQPKFEENIWGKLAKQITAKPKRWIAISLIFFLICTLPIYWIQIYNEGVYNLSDNVESRLGVEVLSKLDSDGFLDRIDLLIDLGEDERFYDATFVKQAVKLKENLQEEVGTGYVLGPVHEEVPLELLQLAYVNKDENTLAELGQLTNFVSDTGRYLLYQIVPEESLNKETRDSLISSIKTHAEEHFVDNQILLGGDPVAFKDFDTALYNDFPIAIFSVLILSFILLTLLFRSIYTAFVAVLGNVVVLGASFGILVFVFQWVFNVEALHPMVPVIIFAISFGLSMDYQVFLLSRIREFQLEQYELKVAIEKGVSYTARTITFAALIMGVIFITFMISDVNTVKMLGFGLAVAVFLDATIARLILMPALLSVGGRFYKTK